MKVLESSGEVLRSGACSARGEAAAAASVDWENRRWWWWFSFSDEEVGNWRLQDVLGVLRIVRFGGMVVKICAVEREFVAVAERCACA